ncbi:hypothetical protein GEMRC1_006855 [Eukaryota sp. GEM-RC1]
MNSPKNDVVVTFIDSLFVESSDILFNQFKSLENVLAVTVQENELLKQKYESNSSSIKNAPTQLFLIGRDYYLGNGVGINHKEAVFYWKKAAQLGHTNAMLNYAFCLRYGRGVPKALDKAVFWFQRAASNNCPEAFYRLGLCFFNGKGVLQSTSKAIECYEQAVELGHPAAMNNLALILDKKSIGEDSKVVELFNRACELSFPPALYNIGILTEKGRFVEQSVENALEYFKKAAEMGCSKSFKKVVKLDGIITIDHNQSTGKRHSDELYRRGLLTD